MTASRSTISTYPFLQFRDIHSLRAFLAFYNIKFYIFTFSQCFIAFHV